MSQDPYQFNNPSNPYAATPMHGQKPTGPPPADPMKTTAPGIALMVVGIIGLVGMGIYLVLTFVGLSMEPDKLQPPPGADGAERTGFYIGLYGALGTMILSLCMQFLVIASGFALMRRQGYMLALSGSIAAVVPCMSPCCVIGIPFGIWALVVLADQQVKDAFAASEGGGGSSYR